MNIKIKAVLYDIVFGLIVIPILYIQLHLIGDIPLSLQAPMIAIRNFGLHNWPQSLQIAAIINLGAIAIAFFANPFRFDKKKYGGAHFATRSEIKSMGLAPGDEGMIFGTHKGELLRMNDSVSVLCIAPPGSGKTACIVVPSLLDIRHSVVVNDPKGEVYRMTSCRRELFSNVVRFAPADRGSAQWNPFSADELPDEWTAIETYINRAASALFPLPPSGDVHWAEKARSILEFWALILTHQNGATSLPEIIRKSLHGDPQELISEALDENGIPEKAFLIGNGLASMSGREFSGVFSTYQAKMEIYLDSIIASNLSGSDFTISEIRQNPTSVYIMVSPQDQERTKNLLALFFDLCALKFMSSEVGGKEQKVSLIIDEFVRLGKMDEVMNLPALSRGYGTNVLFVVQSLAQISEIYGREAVNKLRGSCAYTLLFATNDEETAEKFSRSIGNKTVMRESKSHNSKDIVGGSVSKSEEGIPLLKPQDIQSLAKRKLLILAQNHFQTPIIADAAYYGKHPQMKKIVQQCVGTSK